MEEIEVDEDLALWQGYRNEVHKLILILEQRGEDPIYKSYVLEKLRRIEQEIPIMLDGHLWRQFKKWKKENSRID